MIRLLVVLCMIGYVNTVFVQELTNYYPITPNLDFSSEKFRLLDGDEEHVLMAFSPEVENIGSIIYEPNSQANDALVLSDSELIPFWSVDAINGRFLSARLSTDSHIIAVVVSTQLSLEITLNGENTLVAGMHVLKFDLSGELVWSKFLDGTLRQPCTSIEIDPTDQSIYIVSCIINENFQNPVMNWAGEEFFSVSENADFPDNVIVLKLSALGSEVWGRTFLGFYTDVSATAITTSGVLCISGHASTTIEPIEFAGSEELLDGAYVLAYDQNGNEVWWNTFPSVVNNETSMTRISDLVSMDNAIYVMGSTNSDSLVFNEDTVYFNCFADDVGNVARGNWLAKWQDTGQEITTRAVGCRKSFLTDYKQLVESENTLWLSFQFFGQVLVDSHEFEVGLGHTGYVVIRLDSNLILQSIHRFSSPYNNSFPSTYSSLGATGSKCYAATRYRDELTSEVLSLSNGQFNNSIIFEFSLSNSITELVDEQFLIYPNPAESLLHFNIPKSWNMTYYTVEVIDMTGRIILLADNCTELDISALSSASYVVKFTSKKGSLIEKFIKQ